jgi:hypothetical protein
MKYVKEILNELPARMDIQSLRNTIDSLLRDIIQTREGVAYEIDWSSLRYKYIYNCRRMLQERINVLKLPLRLAQRYKKLYVVKIPPEET